MTASPLCLTVCIAVVLVVQMFGATYADDPLASWNDTNAKREVIQFVERVTKIGSPDFIPEDDRIATFDNDGCLWSEQPMYFQLFFVVDRVESLASQHPEWRNEEPFASILNGDVKQALSGSHEDLIRLVTATHSGMNTDEFDLIVRDWVANARHPKTGKRFTEMVYQPMLELLDYLRDHGFKTFIVSGGGIDFMRPWTQQVYGIPPNQVIGSSIQTKFEYQNGQPVVTRVPKMSFVDDKEGKPVGIQQHIGIRPRMAFGNSDGDLQMLQWTTAGEGPRFGMLIHHTDGDREWSYDRDSAVGKLDKALDAANQQGWTVVDMKEDWKRIYPELPPP